MNLIITCARNLESETKNEIRKILDELGDQEPEILNVGMRGILMVNTIIEPSKIIDWVKNKIIEEPWLIRYCLRIIPIQRITDTEIDKIKQNVIKLKDTIQKNDSYRITIEKRNTSISSNEIITEVAEIFPNKVSLNQPDWIILIEIIGNETGISILKNDELFSLDKAKRMSD
ncbi:RNA methyltransferase [Marine Group I thaumarchaeote]|uniref:RNA methyltransferase n=1 Tax=Marine Group I thaumarchaeote TaxID=2511932 RepID=A0A7K4MPT2_9ARCH|nr:RNA methyltransferase [Marine Group I thaumarchaeote]NWJ68659.1 RNA methyltransferase [Marine Group I thaumarchaeote]NWJ77957.1 RNA methyltransferase [Marine Group I thaumarchaeote]NWJ99744.1 RNA methyltransferase [Marine Group I thaumarchaeote]RTZ70313.1 MAG: RNA methyltransferase [Nitrososphaerota archaeon]